MDKALRMFAVACLLLAASLAGAWPASSDSNLVICDRTGEQSVPKVAASPDGGCYVAWFDHSSGSYCVYAQRLNAQGIPQWAQNGLLISNHPQSTSLTDWDMTSDSSNNAILVFNDTRTDPNRDIYTYKISPAGDFLWGADGIALSAVGNTDFEADPRVAIMTDGSFVFAWQGASGGRDAVKMRKLTVDGADMWSPPIVAITSTNGDDYPRVVAADADSFIVSYEVKQGTQIFSPRWIYMQKFDPSGVAHWTAGGVPVYVGNGIGIQVKPFLLADSLGGAYCAWYDSRLGGVNLRAWVQHILATGAPAWTVNGVQTDTNAGRIQSLPTISRVTGTQDVIAFYLEADASQGNFSIGYQRISAAGARLWGDGGILYSPLDPLQEQNILSFALADGAVVVYEKLLSFGGSNSDVEAFRVDGNGATVWNPSPTVLCSVSSQKIRMDAKENVFGQVIAAWSDGRIDPSWDMYLQNVNADGTLGNLATVNAPEQLTAISADGSDLTLLWQSVANATGYQVYASEDPNNITDLVTTVTDTTVTLTGEADQHLRRYFVVTAVHN